jgi:hypothetical protein
MDHWIFGRQYGYVRKRAKQKDRFLVYFVVAVKYLEELVIAAMKCDPMIGTAVFLNNSSGHRFTSNVVLDL